MSSEDRVAKNAQRNHQNDVADPLSGQTLEVAHNYSRLIGEIPSMFTSAIRSLRNPELRDLQVCSALPDAPKHHLLRLLNSKTLRGPLLHAAKTIHPDRVVQMRSLNTSDFLKLFGPDEMSSIIALIYMNRKISKICEEREWSNIKNQMLLDMEIGVHLGHAIPRIGPGNGILLGGIRYLALGIIASHDLKGFKEYRRTTKAAGVIFDLNHELQRWQCSHLHIGSKLVQTCGFGLAASTGLCLGLSSPGSDIALDEDAYRWKIAGLWIESLRKNRMAPDITHRGEYYPKKVEMEKLIDTVSKIREGSGNFDWIDKTADDLIPISPSVSTQPIQQIEDTEEYDPELEELEEDLDNTNEE